MFGMEEDAVDVEKAVVSLEDVVALDDEVVYVDVWVE